MRKHRIASAVAVIIVAAACAMALLTMLMCIRATGFFGIMAQ